MIEDHLHGVGSPFFTSAPDCPRGFLRCDVCGALETSQDIIEWFTERMVTLIDQNGKQMSDVSAERAGQGAVAEGHDSRSCPHR